MTASCHTCKRPLTVGESAWADDWTVLDGTGPARKETRFTCSDCGLKCHDCGGSLADCRCIDRHVNEMAVLAELEDDETYGMCTGCGSVEVRLVNATGTRDLSYMGESATYPTGYGCEVCA